MADEMENHEETGGTPVSRREAFGFGSAALAAALAVAGTKQASGAGHGPPAAMSWMYFSSSPAS